MYREYDYIIKSLLIGNSGVGKSSIMSQFIDENFNDGYQCTIGVDYKTICMNVHNNIVKILLWDTTGQERFKTITKMYYRNVQAIICVYDITDKISFNNIIEWIKEIENFAPNNVIKLLVGNKLDLELKRQVGVEEANIFSKNHGLS